MKELQQQKIRRVKIRQILLLIIRTLIILLLILAFSRPTLKGNLSAGIGTRVKTSAAVILDNSVSMTRLVRGIPLFDRMKDRAVELVDIFKPGDQVFLVFPNATDKAQGYHDLNLVRRLIDQASIGYKMTDLSAALIHAHQVLAQSLNFNREIYLVSDLQATGFTGDLDSLTLQLASKYKIFVLEPGNFTNRSLSLQKLEMISQILEPGKTIELEAWVQNEGDEPEKNKLIQLFIDGKRTSQTTISLEPGQMLPVQFRFNLEESGLHTGYVELEEDDLSLDNRRDFAFLMPGQAQVLLVSNSPLDTDYIELVLAARNDQRTRFRMDRLKISELSPQKLADAQVIFLVNVPEVEARASAMLDDFIKKGGGLIIFPGDNVNLRQYNEVLNKTLNLPAFSETIGLRDTPESIFMVDRVDYSHPIFAGMFQKKEQKFDSPQFRLAVKVKPRVGSQSIIQYGDGHPFLVENKTGRGSVLLFTSGIQREWSNFAEKTIFAPLIYRSVTYLASLQAEKPLSLTIGEPIRQQLTRLLRNEVEIIRPNQATVKINPGVVADQYLIEYKETDIPGIYTARTENKTLAQWAVNLDARESQLKPIASDMLYRQLAAEKIAPSENPAAFVEKRRLGRELWKYFALFSLGLMILEMLIYREKGEVTGELKK